MNAHISRDTINYVDANDSIADKIIALYFFLLIFFFSCVIYCVLK